MKQVDTRVIEMCPRCRRTPLYRPQPGVVYCYASGCTDKTDDKGELYISLDALKSILTDRATFTLDNVADLIKKAIPLYPQEPK
jgi:hypothetical protein